MKRSFDLAVGLVTPIFTLVGLTLAIFGPATYSYGINRLDAGSRSLWDAGIGSTRILLFFGLTALAAFGVFAGSLMRGRWDRSLSLTMLWSSVVVLLAAALITLPGQNPSVVPEELHTQTPDSVSIGIYLIPAAAAAFLTALVETVIHHEPTGTGGRRPPSPA